MLPRRLLARFTGVLVVLATTAMVLPATLAAASSTPPGARPREVVDPTVGYDVSWPQCTTRSSPVTRALPASAAFGVVGVNGGAPENYNACFAEQYAWARDVAIARPALYANVANPVAAGQRWTAYAGPRPCSRAADDAGCAYDYGFTWGVAAVARLDAVGTEVRPLPWWLDVELCAGCNPWRTDSDAGRLANSASIAGAAAGLLTRPDRVGSVGIYTTGYQWKAITGQAGGLSVRPGTDGLPLWYPVGTDGRDVALAHCGDRATPNGGSVAMVQWLDATSAYDLDASCSPLAPTIATVTQGAVAGQPVTVSGTAPVGGTLTVSVASFDRVLRPVGTVPVGSDGRWSYTRPFASNGSVAVVDSAGLSAGAPVSVSVKVGVRSVRPVGTDRAGRCVTRVDGTTFPYAPGQQVVLRGRRDAAVATVAVRQRGGSGAWSVTVAGTCRSIPDVKITVAGVMPGSGVRYAADTRTAAVALRPSR